jgi:catechol 2,3-dioxygenase-like lactoylglutathione lyase family enzyme
MEIKKIFLETRKLDEVQKFYRETLGLPVSVSPQGELVVLAGNSRIFFREHDGNGQPFYHFAFTIPYNKIEEAREWMKEKISLIWIQDYESEIAEFINWEARSIYFFDPSGNIVELIGRKEFCLDTKNGFGPDDILSVSEIGIVYPKDEYLNKVEEIMGLMGLEYFSRQKPIPGFSAIGNDEGLLIAVYSDRNWYPTKVPSCIFPLEIEIKNDDARYLLQIS